MDIKRQYILLGFLFTFFCTTAWSCNRNTYSSKGRTLSPRVHTILADTIAKIASSYPGEIGVAAIINNRDTVVVNDRSVYPMMSVFKMHQAIAICDFLEHSGASLDSILSVDRDSLDPNTWSPMLKEHPEPKISISIRDLLRYTLTQSDNNASNLMFKKLVNVETTDSLMATLIPRNTFRIAYTEEEMSADHVKAYSNFTSPSGAASLINRLFTDSVVNGCHQDFIRTTLSQCTTGKDRIVAPLIGEEGVSTAHKTGSGYNENGILAAHNDVAYIKLPNGTAYSLAIFIKDFAGNEAQASEAIARISAAIYNFLKLDET